MPKSGQNKAGRYKVTYAKMKSSITNRTECIPDATAHSWVLTPEVFSNAPDLPRWISSSSPQTVRHHWLQYPSTSCVQQLYVLPFNRIAMPCHFIYCHSRLMISGYDTRQTIWSVILVFDDSYLYLLQCMSMFVLLKSHTECVFFILISIYTHRSK